MIRDYDNWRSLNESKIHPDQRILIDLGLLDLTQDQVDFLDKYTNGTWSVNLETGIVDIDGDFICRGTEGNRLRDFFGTRFGRVTGDFYFNSNNLTSLEGAPRWVGGNFECRSNELTSLAGAPKKVGKNFDCCHNTLYSLEGAPDFVNGDFKCYYNWLYSLEGAPKEVAGDFECSVNRLASLDGAPKKVGGNFECGKNYLEPADLGSLEGKVAGKIKYEPQSSKADLPLRK